MRILIADDHPLVRRGVKDILRGEFPFLEYDEAADGEEALTLLAQKPFRLAIVDVAMPGRGGLEFIKDALAFRSGLRILVLSVYTEREFAERAYRAGAAGYLSKTAPPEELLVAVRRILDGRIYVSSDYAELLLRGHGHDEAAESQLSDRELAVAKLFSTGKNLTEIGKLLSLSVKTVSTYKTRVMEKLHLENNAELISFFLDRMPERGETDSRRDLP